MRVRPLLIAVPACAAAGAVTFSVVDAQERPPAGYYQPKVTAGTPQPVRPAGQSDPWAGNGGKGRSPSAVAVGPEPTARQQPVTLPPPKLFFPDPPMPAGGVTQASGTAPVLPPPRVTDVPPAGPVGPRVLVEPPAPAPQPLPLVPPAATVPQPTSPVPLVPTGPAITPISSAPPPAASFPADLVLSPRAAPVVTLDVDAPKEVGVGQPLEYTLVVRNTGTAAVAGVRVEDELPAGSKLVSSDPPAEQLGERLSWSLGGLDAGGERRVKVTVKPGDEGEVRTRAVVTFAAAAEAKVKVTRPKVAVAMEASPTARVGDEVVFTIKVSNTGTGTAGRVLVRATLTDGLHRPEGTVIEAELKDLPPGESRPVALRVLATKSGPQQCVLSVAADGQPAEQTKAGVAVVEPMLTAKLVGPARCLVRGEPEFRVELANPGTAGTDPVQLAVTVPDGFDFLAAADGGTFQPGSRTIAWRLPGLPAGGNRTVSLKLKATAPADGVLRMTAQAAPNDIQQTGGVPAGGKGGRVLEAKGEAGVRAEGVPGLRFEVADLDDPVEVGKEAVYEIKVMNQGTGPCSNVVVTATLADGTQATGASGATQGRGAGQQVVFDPLPTLGVKGEAVYRLRVKGLQPGDLKVRVQVSCDQIKAAISKEENTRFYKE